MQTRPSSHALPRAWLRKAFAIAALACTEAIATDPLSEYRRMLADDNPAELAVARFQGKRVAQVAKKLIAAT